MNKFTPFIFLLNVVPIMAVATPHDQVYQYQVVPQNKESKERACRFPELGRNLERSLKAMHLKALTALAVTDPESGQKMASCQVSCEDGFIINPLLKNAAFRQREDNKQALENRSLHWCVEKELEALEEIKNQLSLSEASGSGLLAQINLQLLGQITPTDEQKNCGITYTLPEQSSPLFDHAREFIVYNHLHLKPRLGEQGTLFDGENMAGLNIDQNMGAENQAAAIYTALQFLDKNTALIGEDPIIQKTQQELIAQAMAKINHRQLRFPFYLPAPYGLHLQNHWELQEFVLERNWASARGPELKYWMSEQVLKGINLESAEGRRVHERYLNKMIFDLNLEQIPDTTLGQKIRENAVQKLRLIVNRLGMRENPENPLDQYKNLIRASVSANNPNQVWLTHQLENPQSLLYEPSANKLEKHYMKRLHQAGLEILKGADAPKGSECRRIIRMLMATQTENSSIPNPNICL